MSLPPTESGPWQRRILHDLHEIAPDQWDALQGSRDTPFHSLCYLRALQDSGAACAESGWQACHLSLWRDDTLQALMPLFLKSHSYGEYVFDWGWAEAYARHGLHYYPKLLSALPFTPVAGRRFLARDEASLQALHAAWHDWRKQMQQEQGISSSHILFLREEEAQLMQTQGMLLRQGLQFHWDNPGYASFDDFMRSLEQKKRKNIAAERRRVRQAGVLFRWLDGNSAHEADWRFFTRCYQATYASHHSSPYLNLDFFLRLAQGMPQQLLLIIASQDGEDVAASLLLHANGVIYGRYWGCVRQIACLHFETAYYQALEFCIAHGLRRFEGGAQGEHKLARGFLPHTTWSAHDLRHPGFFAAVEQSLQHEQHRMAEYAGYLQAHQPFKQPKSGA
ncbi:GNAT family N-acetyltransferase [Massilia sp. W12]|uniref:GNAT family N-acetyltransferase n=1 Tax=Massilia sp. W12 TaxID=3126507 RepID=UPI0030D4CB6C